MDTFVSCTDAVPHFLGLFDLGVAPSLLYYSYVPIIAIALFLALYIVKSDQGSFRSKALFAGTLAFVLWVLNIILQWIVVHANISMFLWQVTAIIEIFIPLSFLYFFYAFAGNERPPKFVRAFSYTSIELVALLLPTHFNMRSFSIAYCEAEVGPLLYVIGIIELAVALWILITAFWERNNARYTKEQRRQISFLAIGSAFFLSIFSASNLLGLVTTEYQINLFGPIGMLIFLGFLAYMIVTFKTFNIKLLATQAFVIVLNILIFSQFFFIQTTTNKILNTLTFGAALLIGIRLVRSVKKEVEARETIEGLAKKLAASNTELEEANEKLKKLDQQKSEFVSIASHQLRSPLTVIKGYLSMFLEGEPMLGDVKHGTVTEKGAEVMDIMFQSTNRLVHIIEDFLNVSRIEQGRMKYEMSDFDVRHMAAEVVGELTAEAERKKLTLTLEDKTPTSSYMVTADSGKIRQVIGNVIDNSIKYTQQGAVTVSLERRGNEAIRIAVKDTGIGISPENLKNLFQKFSRASNAGKVNVTGSGLGLFVAIEIIKAHGGKLWAESEGEGKGSTFIIEIPLKK